MERITSRDNQQVKELAALLSQKKQRDRTGCFALEGFRLCTDALTHNVVVKKAFVTAELLAKKPELEKRLADVPHIWQITGELALRLSQTPAPQGFFLICEKADNAPSSIRIKEEGKYLLLADLQDPGNFGTALRTAGALGVDAVFAAGCPDLYSPKVLRAAMGGVFQLPVALLPNILPAVARLRDAAMPVYAAALTDNALPVQSVELGHCGCGMLIGNEGSGLTQEQIAACNGSVVIPMQEGADSLNAAAAAAILIWEMTRPG